MSEIPPAPTPKKEVIAPRRESIAGEFSDDPPAAERNYGEARLWLVARDPRCLFVYWEIRPEEHPDATNEDGCARFFLRIFRDGEPESSTGIETSVGSLFIPAESADSGYVAELGFFAGDIWCFLARSGVSRTPPELPGTVASPVFATIPAHVGLEKMRDLVADSALPGESPAVTAARIQSDARMQDEWTPGHERLLAEILRANTSAPASPANSLTLTEMIRQKLTATAAAAAPGVPIPASKIESQPASPDANWPTSR